MRKVTPSRLSVRAIRIRIRNSLECTGLSWALLQVHRPGQCNDVAGAVWSMLALSQRVPPVHRWVRLFRPLARRVVSRPFGGLVLFYIAAVRVALDTPPRAARGVQHTKSCFLELSLARITIYICIMLYIHVMLSVLT